MTADLIKRAEEARVSLFRMRVSVTDIASRIGVTREHMSRVLNGHVVSKSLVESVEDWIAQENSMN